MNIPLSRNLKISNTDNRLPRANRYYHRYIKAWLDFHGQVEKKNKFFIHMGSGDIDRDEFPIPKCLINSLIDSVRNSYFEYTYQLGNPYVRKVIADYENHIQGINRFTFNNVAIVLSATGGFSSVIQVLMKHYKYKGNAIIVQPTYPVYESVMWKTFKVKKVCGKEERGFLPLIEDLEKQVDRETRFIILTNPNFPFGKFFDKADLIKLVEISNKRKIYLIIDEIFYDMAYKHIPNIGSIPQKEDYIIRVKAFSKDRAAPGIRIGYVLADDKVTAEMNLLADLSYTCPPTVFDNFIVKDILLRTLMKGGPDIDSRTKIENAREFKIIGNYKKDLIEYERQVNSTLESYKNNRDAVLNEIYKSKYMRAITPDAGINMGVNIIHEGSTYDFFEEMFFKTGVILAPGEAFDMPKSKGNWYRLTFTNNLDKMVEGLNRIKKFIEAVNK